MNTNPYSDLDVYHYIKENISSSSISLSLARTAPPLWRLRGKDPNLRPEYKDYALIQLFLCYKNQILSSNVNLPQKCLSYPYFVWGFSSLLLYIIIVLQLVWTLGMLIIWLDANHNSELCRKRRKMHGSFRNALDLAEAVKEVLGNELCAYSDREITRQLNKSKDGLRFYSGSRSIDDTNCGISHIGISSRKKENSRLRLHDNTLYGRGEVER